MDQKIRLGIIGPGGVTEHLMSRLGEIKDQVSSIAFYDHGGSFEERYKIHREVLFRAVPEYKRSIDCQPHKLFSTFMSNSDAIILNVGADTPTSFLEIKNPGNQIEIVEHFDDLEGILEREARKTYYQTVGQKKNMPEYITEEESVSDFITAYNILKEVKAVQKEGYFERPFRMQVWLPATLPRVMKYVWMMKEYFQSSPAVDPTSKFLIVNSNSSENNLNAILSVLPELIPASVSLAIDKERLITSLNTDQKHGIPSSCLMSMGVVGDHDCYPIPNLGNISLELLSPEDQRRIQELSARIQQNYPQFHHQLRVDLRDFYVKRKGKQNLLDHAGEGVLKILKSIIDSKVAATSGYFRDLSATPVGEKYGLQHGEGLCFVDEYKVERAGGRFKIIPRPQKLDDLTREKFIECQEAHVRLHQRFVQNPLIPVQGFPGTADQQPASTAQSVVDLYGTMKRRHTEILVPVLSVQGKELKQKLVALDQSSLERREIPFEGRKNDDLLRCVEIITLGQKEYIACGFTQDYVLMNPYPFGVDGGHHISCTPREAPQENKIYRVNSLAGIDGKVILSHTLFGVLSVDHNAGEEKVLYAPKKSDGAIRNATVNPYDGNLYVIVGKTVKVFSPAGELTKTFASPGSPDLESMVFDGEHLYATSDRNNQGNSYIYQGRINDPKKKSELTRLSSNFKGDIVEMEIFSREGNTYLLYSNGGQIWLAQVEKDAQGNPTGLGSPQKFHPHKKKITGNLGGVGGIAAGVHGYVSYGFRDPHQQQALYELDLRTREHQLLYDFSGKREYILPTITLLHTER